MVLKEKKQQKPLAFYEDIFVYDTLQWEDEFNPFDGANSESAGRHGGKQQHGGSHDYESGDDNKSLTENLDHLHINNNSVPDDHGIPTVIELTFSRKDVAPDGASLPASAAGFARAHDGVALDVPNNPNMPEMTALYR